MALLLRAMIAESGALSFLVIEDALWKLEIESDNIEYEEDELDWLVDWEEIDLDKNLT